MKEHPLSQADNALFYAIAKLKLGKRLTCCEEAAYYKARYQLLIEREKEAVRIMHSSEDEPDADKRQRKAIRYMGWIRGKKSSRFNSSELFWEYLDLIMGSFEPDTFAKIEAVGKEDAIEILTRRHRFASPRACYQHLKEELARRRITGANIPEILPSSEWVEIAR